MEKTQRRKELHGDLTVPQKGPSITSWKPTQNAVFWVRLSEAEDLGLEFWQTKSFAIMTYATIPGDCIDRVTSDGGDGTLFEQLETPRPPRKAMLSKNWQCQQQHSTSGPDVPSLWEQRQKSEDLPEVQDGSKHILEVDQAAGNLEQSVSTMDEIHTDDVDVTTSTFPSEDANNQIIERIKVGSKKILSSRRSGEGKHGIQSRVHSSRPRHGQR